MYNYHILHVYYIHLKKHRMLFCNY